MSKLVFITGGSGFFGRRICDAFSRRGNEVITMDPPEFDLMNHESVTRAMNKVRPEIIVHSAAYYGGLGICVKEPANLFYRNVIMIANILDAAARAGVRRFISIGSACAYPGGVVGDMKEDDYWAGALHPSVEAYGFTKKVQLVGAHAYRSQFGMEGQFPIITNLYGEHDVFTEYRSHVAAALIKRFADAVVNGEEEVVNWGTGKPVREFIYVGDAAEAVARLSETDCYEPINIGTGIGTSVRELSRLIAKHVGFKRKIVWDESKPDGVMRKVLDVSKMKRTLNWEPPVSLDEGLGKTIKWYLANKREADTRE